MFKLLNNNSLKLINCKPQVKFYASQAALVKKRICIVGAGPAGFYAAQYILKHLDNSYVDIIEKLPVPFGLVRYGVAPDHQEVKNVINTFSKTAENSRFRFLGNLSLGQHISLQQLREQYHAVLLTYGANKDRTLNIPNETLPNVISAREFVAWYNGLPGAQNLHPDLSGKTVTLLGQGNVAIDVARILLTSVDELKKTDITAHAIEALSQSNITKVNLVGRRGPLQAAYTIKELREMIKLPKTSTTWRKDDFTGVENSIPSLPRPKKRITELMIKSLSEASDIPPANKTFEPIFFRSPIRIIGKDRAEAVEYSVNKLINDEAVPTSDTEIIETDLICRSIGYKSVNMDATLNFDESKGCVSNVAGRVLKKQMKGSDDIEDKYEKGVYVSGWLGTGPTGVILTTMNNAFGVADAICKDIETKVIDVTESKCGISENGSPIVSWEGWKKIDEIEKENGAKLGKVREKILDIETMLKIAIS